MAYITETVLAPNCASAECHSELHNQSYYAFDTVAHAQKSLDGTSNGSLGALIGACAAVPCFPGDSPLINVITTKDSMGNRMPLDHPLSNLDIDYIAKWIENGADGYVQP